MMAFSVRHRECRFEAAYREALRMHGQKISCPYFGLVYRYSAGCCQDHTIGSKERGTNFEYTSTDIISLADVDKGVWST